MPVSRLDHLHPAMFQLALLSVAFFIGALLAPVSFALEGGLFAVFTVWLVSRSIEWETRTIHTPVRS